MTVTNPYQGMSPEQLDMLQTVGDQNALKNQLPTNTATPSQSGPDIAPSDTANQAATPAVPSPTPAFWSVADAQKAGTLEPTFAKRIEQMVAASHGQLFIASGYRSQDQQAKLYQEAIQKHGLADAGNWAAPPGQSNHQRGEAVDLGGNLAMAHQLAPQFGLVFPMNWEPWHIEPAGLRAQSPPTAYTGGGPGTLNPTQDPSLDTSPHEIAAKLSNAITGSWMPGTPGTDLASAATGGMIGGNQPTNMGAPMAANGGSSLGGAPAAGASPNGGYSVGAVQPVQGAGTVQPTDLYKALRDQGMDPVHAAAFVSIAGRESGYRLNAVNNNASTGDFGSTGLFQINLGGGWDKFLRDHGFTDPATQLQTVDGSARAAALILQASGLNPWGGYKGLSWSYNTNLNNGVSASGGEVSLAQLEGITGQSNPVPVGSPSPRSEPTSAPKAAPKPKSTPAPEPVTRRRNQ